MLGLSLAALHRLTHRSSPSSLRERLAMRSNGAEVEQSTLGCTESIQDGTSGDGKTCPEVVLDEDTGKIDRPTGTDTSGR
jgi:hypothetical protein